MAQSAHQSVSDLYAAYSAGVLDPGFRLMLEAQAQLRADIARDTAVSDAIVGASLEGEQPTKLSDNLFEKTMDAIKTDAAEMSAARAAGRAIDELLGLPDVVLEPALSAIEVHGWSRLTHGIERLCLDMGGATEVELYRLAERTAVPRHSHHGNELTLVLSGGFHDETGHFGPGDVSIKGPQDTHQPIADDDGPCFTLAVRDGGLKFTGLRGWVQRFAEVFPR